MTSLEFINTEIEQTQTSYKAFELDYELFHRESDKRNAEELIQKLIHLKQIKSKLEAWESIKPDLVIEKRFVNLYEKDLTTIELKNGCIYKNVDKILKALEVSNVKDKR